MVRRDKDTIVQNLKDAGCEHETIDCFLRCMEEHQEEEQARLLEAHRECLLDRVHQEEKKIFCLDYLIYQLRKGE